MTTRNRADCIQEWIRPEVRALSAYHVPPASGMVKLDAMENPYRWPPALIDAWLNVLREMELNRYPDPGAQALLPVLREAMAVPADQALLLGNGSDELIQMIALAMAQPGRNILAPEPGFVMYRMIALFAGMNFIGVPLRADFSLDRDAMLQAVEQHRPAVVFIAYPNNPTGNLFDAADIEAVIAASPGLVVLDEAYHAFAGASFMEQLGRWPNLLVMRTLSKLGLAGLRLGLLAGAADWLKEFDKIRLPYNINVLTQASARFVLEQRAVLDEQTARIVHDREHLAAALRAQTALTVYPSRANFILVRVPAGRADSIFSGLREHRVLVKNLHGAGGLLRDCLRVTVGTPAENAAFLHALARCQL